MNLDNLWQLIDKHKFSKAEISNNSVELKEEDLQSKQKQVLYKFNIIGVSSDTLVIKCPQNQEGFFDKTRGYTKICDYLIFILNDQKVTVIFCELKNTLGSYHRQKEASQQIKSTIPLLQYILAGVEEHFGDKWIIENMHYTIIANGDDVLPKDTIFSSEEQYVKGIVNGKDVCEGMNFNTIVGTSDSPKIPIQELMYNQI